MSYSRTRTKKDWEELLGSQIFKQLQDDIKPVVVKQEVHRSQAFIGHIDQEAPLYSP
jgi:hypothetical protein